MSSILDFASAFADTVTIAPYASQNVNGEDTYGTPVTYTARCVGKNTFVFDKVGNQQVSKTKTYLLSGVTTLTVDDLITLPSRFRETQPTILAIEVVLDEAGAPHHTIVYS